MSRRALLVVLGLCAGCDPVVERIELDFVLADGCEDRFESLMAISIEGIANNGECKNSTGCVLPVVVESLEEFEAEIRDARRDGEPVVDIDLDRTEQIAVNGRPCFSCYASQAGCDNTPILCGVANLDDREDGILPVVLGCGACVESLEACQE